MNSKPEQPLEPEGSDTADPRPVRYAGMADCGYEIVEAGWEHGPGTAPAIYVTDLGGCDK
jgi:hypothetical protein